jgi:hypothetical protein
MRRWIGLNMHPNAFLKTFWRLDLKPQVFVAMSFSERSRERFENVIEPAILGCSVNGVQLTPQRVDLSQTGDFILTDIVEGIAHSQLVLADVSSIGRDSETQETFRNGNVMYEVGVALACRQPEEVLLVRDDNDKFLFDVSAVPHMRVDFANFPDARSKLKQELHARLRSQSHAKDARVQCAFRSLSVQEFEVLQSFKKNLDSILSFPESGTVNFRWMAAIPRLLDKQVIELVGSANGKDLAYRLTALGKFVTGGLDAHLATVKLSLG